MQKDELERALLAELLDSCVQVRELSRKKGSFYNPTWFEGMLRKHGVRETVRRLIPEETPKSGDAVQLGLERLQSLDLLEYSLEWIVLKPKYLALTTPKQRAVAQRRLEDRRSPAPTPKGKENAYG